MVHSIFLTLTDNEDPVQPAHLRRLNWGFIVIKFHKSEWHFSHAVDCMVSCVLLSVLESENFKMICLLKWLGFHFQGKTCGILLNNLVKCVDVDVRGRHQDDSK